MSRGGFRVSCSLKTLRCPRTNQTMQRRRKAHRIKNHPDGALRGQSLPKTVAWKKMLTIHQPISSQENSVWRHLLLIGQTCRKFYGVGKKPARHDKVEQRHLVAHRPVA